VGPDPKVPWPHNPLTFGGRDENTAGARTIERRRFPGSCTTSTAQRKARTDKALEKHQAVIINQVDLAINSGTFWRTVEPRENARIRRPKPQQWASFRPRDASKMHQLKTALRRIPLDSAALFGECRVWRALSPIYPESAALDSTSWRRPTGPAGNHALARRTPSSTVAESRAQGAAAGRGGRVVGPHHSGPGGASCRCASIGRRRQSRRQAARALVYAHGGGLGVQANSRDSHGRALVPAAAGEAGLRGVCPVDSRGLAPGGALARVPSDERGGRDCKGFGRPKRAVGSPSIFRRDGHSGVDPAPAAISRAAVDAGGGGRAATMAVRASPCRFLAYP